MENQEQPGADETSSPANGPPSTDHTPPPPEVPPVSLPPTGASPTRRRPPSLSADLASHPNAVPSQQEQLASPMAQQTPSLGTSPRMNRRRSSAVVFTEETIHDEVKGSLYEYTSEGIPNLPVGNPPASLTRKLMLAEHAGAAEGGHGSRGVLGGGNPRGYRMGDLSENASPRGDGTTTVSRRREGSPMNLSRTGLYEAPVAAAFVVDVDNLDGGYLPGANPGSGVDAPNVLSIPGSRQASQPTTPRGSSHAAMPAFASFYGGDGFDNHSLASSVTAAGNATHFTAMARQSQLHHAQQQQQPNDQAFGGSLAEVRRLPPPPPPSGPLAFPSFYGGSAAASFTRDPRLKSDSELPYYPNGSGVQRVDSFAQGAGSNVSFLDTEGFKPPVGTMQLAGIPAGPGQQAAAEPPAAAVASAPAEGKPRDRTDSIGLVSRLPAEYQEEAGRARRRSRTTTDSGNSSFRQKQHFFDDLPVEVIRYTIDHYVAIKYHNTLRLISKTWNAIVTSNCTLWHRRLPMFLIAEESEVHLDKCRLHHAIREAHEAAVEALQQENMNNSDGQLSESEGGVGGGGMGGQGAIVGPRPINPTLMARARVKVTYCFNGCCYRCWREDEAERRRLEIEESATNAEIWVATRVAKSLFYPPGSSGGYSAATALCVFGAFLAFIIMGRESSIPLYVRFVPLWVFFIILYPIVYSFFAASTYIVAMTGFVAVFLLNLTALIGFFVAESTASWGNLIDSAGLISIAPALLGIFVAFCVNAKELWRWVSEQGIATITFRKEERIAPSTEEEPPETRHRLVSKKALLLMATGTIVSLCLLLFGLLFAIEIDVTFEGTHPSASSGNSTSTTPAPVRTPEAPFHASGLFLIIGGFASLFAVYVSAQVISIDDILDEEPFAGVVMVFYALTALGVSACGFVFIAGPSPLMNVDPLAYTAAVTASTLLIGMVLNAGFTKEPDREWWLGYALYP